MDLERLARILGTPALTADTIGSGVGGDVARVHLAHGRSVIAKASDRVDLRVEARSLRVLAPHLPVPSVLHDEERLILLEDVSGRAADGAGLEPRAAELLASLHAVTSMDATFGLDFQNFIGPLPQDNTPSRSWVEFFRERRLRPMARRALDRGSISASTFDRAEKLASRLADFIPERPSPALIHGDIWSGNVLPGPVFIDPSPSFAHAEIELAFIALFSTFGGGFFDRYFDLRDVPAAERRSFFRTRKDLYNLYPLLVHATLFGGHYGAEADATLRRLAG